MNVLATDRRAQRFALVLLLAAAATAQGPAPVEVRRTPFPEGRAAIEQVLVHFDPSCGDAWLPTFRDLLAALPDEVQVTVAVAGSDEAACLSQLIGSREGSRGLEVLEVGEPVTCWARDRTLVLSAPGASPELLTPPEEQVEPGYEGDLAVATSLSTARGVRSLTWFEGGDLAYGGSFTFVGWGSVLANVDDDESVDVGIAAFERLTGTPTVVVGRPVAPHRHLDMYLTVLDERTVLLGDPVVGRELLAGLDREPGVAGALPEHDAWTDECQLAFVSQYTVLARQLRQHGLRVLRVPIVHGERGSVLTWNNALVECRDEGRRAYVPVYGVPALDEMALQVYRDAGIAVFPIDVAELAPLGGTVRCVTNVVAWRTPRGRS